jgi:hypothetical protein
LRLRFSDLLTYGSGESLIYPRRQETNAEVAMKAIEFEAVLKPDHTLRIPEEVVSQLPQERKFQVIVLLPESSDHEETEANDWRKLASEQFAAGYCDGDAIYDSL